MKAKAAVNEPNRAQRLRPHQFRVNAPATGKSEVLGEIQTSEYLAGQLDIASLWISFLLRERHRPEVISPVDRPEWGRSPRRQLHDSEIRVGWNRCACVRAL